MLVFVSVDDYMPTTEATGIRLAIHEKEQFPFPDAFGYSAPTGVISSFGMRLVRKMILRICEQVNLKYFETTGITLDRDIGLVWNYVELENSRYRILLR